MEQEAQAASQHACESNKKRGIDLRFKNRQSLYGKGFQYPIRDGEESSDALEHVSRKAFHNTLHTYTLESQSTLSLTHSQTPNVEL